MQTPEAIARLREAFAREEIGRFADVAGYRAFMSGRTTTRSSPRRTPEQEAVVSVPERRIVHPDELLLPP
jgi:hypothetical protein